jgi:hypothetical protein
MIAGLCQINPGSSTPAVGMEWDVRLASTPVAML